MDDFKLVIAAKNANVNVFVVVPVTAALFILSLYAASQFVCDDVVGIE